MSKCNYTSWTIKSTFYDERELEVEMKSELIWCQSRSFVEGGDDLYSIGSHPKRLGFCRVEEQKWIEQACGIWKPPSNSIELLSLSLC